MLLGWPKSLFGFSHRCYGKPKELFGQPVLYMISSTLVVSSTGDKLSLGSSQMFDRNMIKTSLFPQALECTNWI